jgi:hypothetical protein
MLSNYSINKIREREIHLTIMLIRNALLFGMFIGFIRTIIGILKNA